MTLGVSRHLSEPYKRTDFTFELKIFNFVYKKMYRDLQTGLDM